MEMGETPLTIELTPGAHKITVTAPGYESKDVDVSVEAGKKAEQSIELTAVKAEPEPAPIPPPVVEPPPEPAPPPEKRSKVPAYVTLGIAGAGAVVGTFFGIKALSAKSDFDDNPTVDNADRTDRNALIADMSFAVALTFGVTGAVLLFGGDDKPAQQQTATTKLYKPVVAPFVGPTGGGGVVSFKF